MTYTVSRLFPDVVARTVMAMTVGALTVAAMTVGAVTVGAGAAAASSLSPNWEESGQASWYGGRFEGRRTSSGGIFDPYQFTAAHDTLPLGTRIRVTRQDTGSSVVVTITDRMPPKRVRIIDLSREAARKLGLIASGVGPVTLTEAVAVEPEEVAEAPDDTAAPRRRHLGRATGRRAHPRH